MAAPTCRRSPGVSAELGDRYDREQVNGLKPQGQVGGQFGGGIHRFMAMQGATQHCFRVAACELAVHVEVNARLFQLSRRAGLLQEVLAAQSIEIGPGDGEAAPPRPALNHVRFFLPREIGHVPVNHSSSLASPPMTKQRRQRRRQGLQNASQRRSRVLPGAGYACNYLKGFSLSKAAPKPEFLHESLRCTLCANAQTLADVFLVLSLQAGLSW